jgi:tRNA(fMet)-specific endonuclease VapC
LTLSLDTNVLIDLANRRTDRLRQRFEQAVATGEAVTTCSIAAHELVFGAVISRRPPYHLELAHRLLGSLNVTELSFEDAESAANLRAALRRLGQTIGSFDTLIAGQALCRGWTMVTANVREFGRVPGLRIIDWTSDSESP